MEKLKECPELILIKTLQYAVGDVDCELKHWKQGLPLLTVCQSWREIVKRELYRCAFVEVVDPNPDACHSEEEAEDYEEDYEEEEEAVTASDSSDWESISSSVDSVGNIIGPDGEKAIRSYTNIPLIKANNMQGLVKRMIFSDVRSQLILVHIGETLGSFMAMLRVMYTDPREFPGFLDYIEWFEAEMYGMEQDPLVVSRCFATSTEIAANLKANFPNVKDLNIAMPSPHELLENMFCDLIAGYDAQLARLYCRMPAYFPRTLAAPKLVELNLGVTHTDDARLPIINPQSLRSIELRWFRDMPFSWEMFRFKPSWDTIVFANLVELTVIYDDYDEPLDMEAAAGSTAANLKLVFPKLKRLYIASIVLPVQDIQYLVQPTLKSLRYEGSLKTANTMCKYLTGDLEELNLHWNGTFFLDEAEYFESMTNEIFNKTDGIQQVVFSINCADYYLDLDGVSWPYLTHLNLNFMLTIGGLLEFLPAMANLTFLSLDMDECDPEQISKDTEFLLTIETRYPEPIPSKLTTLSICDSYFTASPHSCQNLPFYEALGCLQLCLPDLKTIEITS